MVPLADQKAKLQKSTSQRLGSRMCKNIGVENWKGHGGICPPAPGADGETKARKSCDQVPRLVCSHVLVNTNFSDPCFCTNPISTSSLRQVGRKTLLKAGGGQMTRTLCLVLGVFSFVLKCGALSPILSNAHPRLAFSGAQKRVSVTVCD